LNPIINGVEYKAVPAPARYTCNGCAALEDLPLCGALPDCGRGDKPIVFQRVETPSTRAWAGLPATRAVLTAEHDAIVNRAASESDGGWGEVPARPEPVWAGLAPVVHKPVHGGFPELPAFVAGLARTSDPVTSKEAAATVSGGKLCDQILVALEANASVAADMAVPDAGYTGKELAQLTGIPLNSVTPRFAQLRRKGLIHAIGKRDKQLVWRVGNGVAA
jgi:hypothetical protein